MDDVHALPVAHVVNTVNALYCSTDIIIIIILSHKYTYVHAALFLIIFLYRQCCSVFCAVYIYI